MDRRMNGKLITRIKDSEGHTERRFGYPTWFFNRIWFLEALYEKLHYNDRILLGKRVVGIEHGPDDVKVATKDGQVYTGSVVVGCDDIYSVVRTEMARIANAIQPGTFDDKEEEKIPCYYQCSFGIAQNVEQWQDENIKHTCFRAGDGHSFVVSSGPGNRVFWFLTVRLPEVKYGKDIPRYTKEDKEEFLKKHAHLRIQKNLTFGQLTAKSVTSSLTSIHEVVIKKWFYKRMVLIGGNNAIESGVEFMNALLKLRDSRREGLRGVTSEEIEAVSRKMQDERYEITKFLVNDSHLRQGLFASESPLKTRVALGWIIPLIGQKSMVDDTINRYTQGVRLNELPVPFRPRLIPYDVDLPAKPLSSAVAGIAKLLLIAFMATMIYITTKAWRMPLEGLGDWGDLGPLNRNWLGNNGFNNFLQKIVSAFAYPMFGSSPTAMLQLTYFLSQLAAPMLVWTIEGYRSGNSLTPLALPSVFLVAMQLQGVGQIAPLYYILSALFAGERNAGRWIPVHVAKALVPALTLGYILPTVMMLTPRANARSWQDWTALWQFSPILFTTFTALFASVIKQWKKLTSSVKESPFDFYKDEDVPILKSVYYYAFALLAAAHASTLAYAYLHPDISFAELSGNLPNPFDPEWSLPTVTSQIAVFLKYDFAMCFVSVAVYGLYAIWTLRKMGYIKTSQAAVPLLACILGQVLVGPGATMVGLWSWRESVLADLSTINKPPPDAPKKNDKVTNEKLSTDWQPVRTYNI
ncbi:FAD binding domain protein [Hypoxylon sp. FL1150]|nr:FAD binding domain protein [Hypoxylon sp. FL1150]